jgi:hypothetical protein
MLMLFFLSVVLYFMNLQDAVAVREKLEATELCFETASVLGSFAAIGGDSTYTLNLSQQEAYKNYTIWVNSGQGALKVNYGSGGAGCRMQFSNFTNSSGATFFMLEKNATLRNEDGVVWVE